MVHRLHCWQVHPKGICYAGQIQTKLKQEVYEIHLFTRKWIMYFGTGEVALGPGALVYPVVCAQIVMIFHIMHVMLVKKEYSTFSPG